VKFEDGSPGVSRTNPWGSHGRRGYRLPWDFPQVGAE